MQKNATKQQNNIGSKVKTVRFYNGLVAFPTVCLAVFILLLIK